MSEPITVAAQLVRGEWADETAEGESGALENLTDLMREAGVMIRDQYDALARLRQNIERWEMACKLLEWNDYEDGWVLNDPDTDTVDGEPQRPFADVIDERIRWVQQRAKRIADAAIEAEKGKPSSD